MLAAFAAGRGFAGDEGLLELDSGPLQGDHKNKEKLVRPPNEEFLITQTALKPYPSARQALAAIEALKEILSVQGSDPNSIDEVTVHVPNPYAAMIDNTALPGTRQESLLGVQYQMALAAFHPEILLDVNRELLPDGPEIVAFMQKVRILPSPELERLFPRNGPQEWK